MNSNDFLSFTPKFLQSRFYSINKYVWDILVPRPADLLMRRKKNERKKELERIKSISNEASIIVYIYLLNKFFKEGSSAAKSAVDTFKELNIEGFYIGQNYFSGRNNKVLQGERIAQVLLESIKDEKAKDLILKSDHVSDILDKYKELIQRK